MGGAFLLAFAAFDTIQVFAKRLYPGDLGPNMTMAIYITFTLSEFFAPAVVNTIGPRLSMGLGICGYASVVIAGMVFFSGFQSSAMVLAAGCILGVGAGMLWTGQGRLILDYSTPHDRGVLFGIFWALYRMASVLGGLLSFTYFSVNDKSSGSFGLYVIFLVLICGGALLTLALKAPEDCLDDSSDSNGHAAPRQINATEASSFFDEVRATGHAFRNRTLLTLALMFWASGGNEPYILSGFTDRWFEKRTTGLEMVWYFSSSIIGVLMTGTMLDRFTKRHQERSGAIIVLMLASLVHVAGFALAAVVETSAYWNKRYTLDDANIILPSIVFILWGWSDAMINSFLYWIIGVRFTSGPERARAIGFFKLLNSAAHIVGYAILPVHRVPATFQLLYNVVIYIAGAIMAATVACKLKADKVELLADHEADDEPPPVPVSSRQSMMMWRVMMCRWRMKRCVRWCCQRCCPCMVPLL